MIRKAIAATAAIGFLLIPAACSPSPVKVSIESVQATDAVPEAILQGLSAAPYDDGEDAPLPDAPVKMPTAGEMNAFGLAVSPDMAKAYRAYLAGDGAGALAALDRVDRSTASELERWNAGTLRAQVLIMAGRAADAEDALDAIEGLERKLFGQTIHATAIRGEARVWMGEYDRAREAFSVVASAVRSWRLPTFYTAPPSNLAELVYASASQLRTYTGLAGMYLLEENPKAALKWAERAETLFGDVHYVADHSLYGQYMPVFADSFYGRATNLAFLAAARAIVKGDPAAGRETFALADGFFDVVGYRPGKATTQALRAWAALRAGKVDEANAEAAKAVDMALKASLPDLVWRVQILRGEALLADNRPNEAEAVFRSADAAVDLVSGGLSSDRAKTRFGVGKEDISYHLARFDRERGDLSALYRDMERARARAFVDMLAGRPVAEGRGGAEARRIRAIDDKVRLMRLTSGNHSKEKALLRERAALVKKLARRDRELADVYRVETSTLADVRRALGGDETMMYALPARASDPVRFLAIRKDGAEIVEATATVAALDKALTAFTDGIALDDAAMQTKAAATIGRALGLSRWPAAGRYHVVPSGPVFRVPWGAVTDKAAVAVLPTGGWVLRGKSAKRKRGATVVGDPEFAGRMPQLPGARAEAKTIAARYKATPIIGAGASESALRSRVGRGAGVLHLATHGTFDAAYPLRSAVMLAGAGGVDPLSAEELFARPLASDVVVLSACETGVGRVEAGDDFLGLPRAFYLGGSRAVVNSLWPVDDQGTRLYMETFHDKLTSGAGLGEAWLAARDATRKAGHPPSVYGAFVLGGAL